MLGKAAASLPACPSQAKDLYNHQNYKMMFWPLLSPMPIHMLCILRKSGSQVAQGATPAATVTSLPQCSRVEEQPVCPHISICVITTLHAEVCILLQILKASRDENVLVSQAGNL